MSNTETVTFTASGELAEWLKERSERRMKSVSSVTENLVAEKVQEIRGSEAGKSGQTGENEPEALSAKRSYEFPDKQYADEMRNMFTEYLSDGDDTRQKEVWFEAGTPGAIVKILERRSQG